MTKRITTSLSAPTKTESAISLRTTSGLGNIEPKYPFKEDGITKEDVYRILEENGIGLPAYYQWRTRSGCYFCFFQRKSEWVGLIRAASRPLSNSPKITRNLIRKQVKGLHGVKVKV